MIERGKAEACGLHLTIEMLDRKFSRISKFSMVRFCTLAAILSLIAACADRSDTMNRSGHAARNDNRSEQKPEPEPEDKATEEFEGTAGIVEKKKPGSAVATLSGVRTARHANFDRVVFEFEGGILPGYHIEYIDRPVRQCGSGRVVELKGDGWLRVRLQPAYAHTEQGEPTVKDRERFFDYPLLKELEIICDFEADVSWVMGLSSPNRYRVLELSNPARLVVDIKHQGRL